MLRMSETCDRIFRSSENPTLSRIYCVCKTTESEVILTLLSENCRRAFSVYIVTQLSLPFPHIPNILFSGPCTQ